MFSGCFTCVVEHYDFRSDYSPKQTHLHATWYSERNAYVSAFCGDDRLRISVRTDRRIQPKISSDNGLSSTFADFLRFRRVYKHFSADEHCRNILGLQDGDDANRRCPGNVLVLSQVFK